jgi:hypothetical protein
MKRGDRRALDRAAEKLPLTSGEKLLAFEIGNLRQHILPKSFPLPLSKSVKRIDLVGSDHALYIHAGGDVLRLGWEEILEFALSDESFISWRLRSGEKGQVKVRAPRDLSAVVNSQLELFEAIIGEGERDEREQLRVHFAEHERRTRERREVLGCHNQFRRALSASGSIFTSDGDTFVAESITLGNFGIEFVGNDLKPVIIPYGSVLGHTEYEDGHALAAIDDERYEAFHVRVAANFQISEWMDDVEILKAIDLG